MRRAWLGVALGVVASACGGHASVQGSDAAEGNGPPIIAASRSRLACGEMSTCYLRDDGVVRCWGANDFAALGNGSVSGNPFDDQLPPTSVVDLADVVGLAGGPFATCALDSKDDVRCWGVLPAATDQEPSMAVLTTRPTPLPVHGVATVAFGAEHACVLMRSGQLSCWGPSVSGGSGGADAPRAVPGISGAIDVANNVGGSTWAALSSLVPLLDGDVLEWGRTGSPGLLPNDHDLPAPVPLAGVSDVRQVTIGTSHACAVQNAGTVMCWGADFFAQCGFLSPSAEDSGPVTVAGLADVAEVHAGEDFTCARRTNGEVWCWGDAADSHLALKDTGYPMGVAPVQVDVPPVTDLCVGFEHSCVRTEEGRVLCWGGNHYGQIGLQNTLGSLVTTPLEIEL